MTNKAICAFLCVFSGLVTLLFQQIPLEPAKAKGKLIYCTEAVPIIIGFFGVAEIPAAKMFLALLDQALPRYLFFAVCCLFALLPSFFAQRAGSDAASPSYVAGNRAYNLLGVACPILATEILYRTIQNTAFLNLFYSTEIVQALIPLCLWIALSYQYQEQQKASDLDYSPSLKWKGQVLNVLHLVNTYFWSFLAEILLICYTLYCHVHSIPIRLNFFHLLAFSMILIFFYIVALNTHTYLYLLFLAATPAILIYGIQWQSWSVLESNMVWLRALVIPTHYLAYAYIVYSKEASKRKSTKIAAALSAAGIFLCCISRMPGWLTPKHILLLSIPLILVELHSIFFRRPTSYQMTLILTPAFLICTVSWTSSIVTTQSMAYQQAFFVILHLSLYMLAIFAHIKPHTRKSHWAPVAALIRKLPAFLAKYLDRPQETEEEAKEKLAKKLLLGDYFFSVVFFVILLAYPLFCTLPFQLEQVSYHMAVNHISALCDDPQQADELLSEIRSSPWYTDDPMLAQPEIEQAQYLVFLYDHLQQEMVAKGAIPSTNTEVTADELYKWYSERAD